MTVDRLMILGILSFGCLTVLQADIIIDPDLNPNQSGSVNPEILGPVGQSFIANVSDITWIGMYTDLGCTCFDDYPIEFQLDLLNGSGLSGSLVASETAFGTPDTIGYTYFDFSGTSLTVGDSYTAVLLELTPPPPGNLGIGVEFTSNVYSGGEAFGDGTADPNFDYYLRVLSTQTIPPVLEPVSLPESPGWCVYGADALIVGLLWWILGNRDARVGLNADVQQDLT